MLYLYSYLLLFDRFVRTESISCCSWEGAAWRRNDRKAPPEERGFPLGRFCRRNAFSFFLLARSIPRHLGFRHRFITHQGDASRRCTRVIVKYVCLCCDVWVFLGRGRVKERVERDEKSRRQHFLFFNALPFFSSRKKKSLAPSILSRPGSQIKLKSQLITLSAILDEGRRGQK